MALDRVAKLVVAVHRDDCDEFLNKLQRFGIFHIIPAGETPEETAESRTLMRLQSAVELLAATASGRDKARPILARDEFEQVSRSYNPGPELDRLESISREMTELDVRQKQLEAEQGRLEPWRGLRQDPQDLYRLADVQVSFVRFADSGDWEQAKTALADMPAALEETGRSGTEISALMVVAREAAAEAGRALAGLRFETTDLKDVQGRPADVLGELAVRRERLERRRAELLAETRALSAKLAKLKLAADAAANEQKRERAKAQAQLTGAVAFFRGWVRARDLGRFEELVRTTPTAAFERIEPEPGEEPPVALVNRPVFRPFELVLELFSMPSPKEMDPTWLVAPFFGIFFGLCLTDAGYGIVVAIAAWLLMRRMGLRNKLLGIVLFGAILTIPAGAMVGGWFGDLPDRIGIGWLTQWKNRLMWFDPMKDPMKFFLLSVVLGYTQLMAGIVFEITDCLRNRDWGQGILGQLPWFVLLNGIVVRVAAGRFLPEWVNAGLVLAVFAAIAAIIVFTQRERRTALPQGLWFGALLGLLTHLGARFRLLPAGYLAAKWLTLLFFVALLVSAAVSFVGDARRRPVGLIAGGITVAALAGYAVGLVPWFVPGLVGAVFFALAPAGASLFGKLFWGGYALYGATSYVGVVLSYIRLMALGMCTGGVAMAINVIAWMLLKIPVVGVVAALVVLAGGHAYNIAVNVLGAFVHSLRLQYVEFFPRFYTGGGERFEPLAEEYQYVTVK
uniref:V-type ATP synthase subunit I n=1 Tax=candidate division WOR-3 bacterium TaxID=2052148 RepID=A0A7C4CB48_UNCW3